MLARARAGEKNYSNFASRVAAYMCIFTCFLFFLIIATIINQTRLSINQTPTKISRELSSRSLIYSPVPLRFYLFILFYFFLNCRGATCARAMLSRSLLVFLPAENYSRFYWKLAAGSIYNLFSSFFLTSFTFIFLSCYIN